MITRLTLIWALLLVGCSPTKNNVPKPTSKIDPLVVYSSTDTQAFSAVLDDFKQLRPEIAVRYVEVDAHEAFELLLHGNKSRPENIDLILSSAMDLQTKLVNDGYARSLPNLAGSQTLPSWARWRDEAFGFTFEPAVMVFNTKAMSKRKIPRSRAEFAEAIKRDPQFWRGCIGTYDITQSSVGYLLSSQDDRQSGDIGTLLQAFGQVDVRFGTKTSDLLEKIKVGKLTAGYNLLGSYARREIEKGAPLTIVYPQDYTLAVSRTAVIPRSSRHPETARILIEYLLSPRGQRVLARDSGLNAVRPDTAGSSDELKLARGQIGPLRPIGLGAGLLTYLDHSKRERFLRRWRMAVEPNRGAFIKVGTENNMRTSKILHGRECYSAGTSPAAV